MAVKTQAHGKISNIIINKNKTSSSRQLTTYHLNLKAIILLVLISLSCVHSIEIEEEETCSAVQPKQEDLIKLEPTMADIDFKKAESIYDFTVKDTYGNDVKLDKYNGFVVVIVNIASQCGLTKNNYAKLTELNNKYFEKGLRILAFPCNQFASQSPEADGEETVCQLKAAHADIGDVFAHVDVNGDKASPLWKYLKHKQTGILGISAIKWNFTKFLIDKNGQPVDRYAPTTDPMDIAAKIETLL